MKRRHFLKGTALTAFAVSTTGFIAYNGSNYVGDCETTTDILGPFYRPNAPMRTNLVIKDLPGEEVVLKGMITHDDCTTPLKNAKVELWHCSNDEIYDNESEDYNYRGTTLADDHGNYHFRTQFPVPYDAGGGMYRPAHFHLMISAAGYQNLVTQLYFTGDPYLEKDLSSNAPNAVSRILDLEKDDDGTLLVPFNVIMQKELKVDPVALNRLTGVYLDEKNSDRKVEYFEHEGHLWIRNEVFGRLLHYKGDNTFEVPGSQWGGSELKFHIQSNGKVKVEQVNINSSGDKRTSTLYRMS